MSLDKFELDSNRELGASERIIMNHFTPITDMNEGGREKELRRCGGREENIDISTSSNVLIPQHVFHSPSRCYRQAFNSVIQPARIYFALRRR